MKARAAANVRRAAPGPTATCLFASDVCLGELALEWARCRHCHLHKVRLNAARAYLAGIQYTCAITNQSTPIVSTLLVGNMNRKKNPNDLRGL